MVLVSKQVAIKYVKCLIMLQIFVHGYFFQQECQHGVEMTGVRSGFGFKNSKVLAHCISDHWGFGDLEAAIAAIPQWISHVHWQGPFVDVGKWLVSGHSNGGDGASTFGKESLNH